MSETGLLPRPALAGLIRPGRYGAAGGAAGVRIGPRTGLALATLSVRKGRGDALSEAVRAGFGAELPKHPRVAHGDGGVAFIWAGPGSWLVLRQNEDLEPVLRAQLGVHASVTDQSDGRTVLRVEGPYARDLLTKGLPIDLYPRAFAAGDVALSLLAHVGVHLWQLDDAPSYEIAVLSGYARSLLAWMLHSGAEYGIDLVAEA
ncbi:MAG: sarcosine oxidase, gamma subunit [Acetobacteraceae bacterium]|nr:sarcosine oxidase, gamma subunit [Acetobacteraceae bacterium]